MWSETEKQNPLIAQGVLPARRTGLEPAASGVTGRRYNQLNYHPNTRVLDHKVDQQESAALDQV